MSLHQNQEILQPHVHFSNSLENLFHAFPSPFFDPHTGCKRSSHEHVLQHYNHRGGCCFNAVGLWFQRFHSTRDLSCSEH